jgi:hypothetical protein
MRVGNDWRPPVLGGRELRSIPRHSRSLTRTLSVAVAGLLCGGLTPVAAVADAPLPALVGQVLTQDGTPVPNAAVVLSVLQRVDSKSAVPADIIIQGQAGPDGTFTLPIPAATPARASAAALNGGRLNTLATAFRPQAPGTGAMGMEAVPFTLSGPSLVPSRNQIQIATQPVTTSPSGQPSDFGPVCGVGVNQVGPYQYAYTTVAELHGWDDMQEVFKYINTASTEVDVGASSDGTNWHVAGSVAIANTKSSTNTLNQPGRFGAEVKPQFEYEEQQETVRCFGESASSYTVQATQAVAGIITGADVSRHDGPDQYAANNRMDSMAEFPAGAQHSKITGNTSRYSTAASLFGFTFGTTSQYSPNLDYEWTMGTQFPGHFIPSQTEYHLWGDTGNPDEAQNAYAYSGSDLVTGSGNYSALETYQAPLSTSGFTTGNVIYTLPVAVSVSNLVNLVYAGTVTLSGSGFTTANLVQESGTLDLTMSGFNAAGLSLECPFPGTRYTRTGPVGFMSGLSDPSDCSVNGVPTGSVALSVVAHWVPTSSNVVAAELDGSFAIAAPTKVN